MIATQETRQNQPQLPETRPWVRTEHLACFHLYMLQWTFALKPVRKFLSGVCFSSARLWKATGCCVPEAADARLHFHSWIAELMLMWLKVKSQSVGSSGESQGVTVAYRNLQQSQSDSEEKKKKTNKSTDHQPPSQVTNVQLTFLL